MPFGFAGAFTDRTGLIYLVHRYYDPATGQFLTVDPIVDQTKEPYAYGSGDPVNNADPSGMDVCLFGHCVWTPSVQNVGDFSAGFGDTVTLGGTAYVRGLINDAFGLPNTVNSCSGWYTGGGWTGLGTTVLLGGYGAVRAAGVAAEEAAELEATPAGRVFSAHYLSETGPVRNIPGSVVDEAIDHGQVVEKLADRTVYFDAKNDVTVVQSDTTGRIMSVRRGAP